MLKQYEIILKDNGRVCKPFYKEFLSLEDAQSYYKKYESITEMIEPIPFENLTNWQRFMILVSGKDTSTFRDGKMRVKNRYWLKVSQKIALDLLEKRDELKLTDEEFAKLIKIDIRTLKKTYTGKFDIPLSVMIKIHDFGIPIFQSGPLKWRK